MKRLIVPILTILMAVLILSVLLYAGDDKSVKKEIPKTPQTQVQKPCTDKHCQDMCKGQDSSKCTYQKGSTECKDKHAKGECKDKCSEECLKKCAGQDKPPKK